MGPASALAALAVACNVAQLVQQALHVVKSCKEIYVRGSLERHDDMEQFSKDITEANKELQNELSHARLSARDARLRRIAENSLKSSDALKDILNQIKFRSDQGSGSGPALKAWIRTARKKGAIEKLQRDLEQQDRLLQSEILKDL